MTKTLFAAMLFLAALSSMVAAGKHNHQPYAGQQQRAIASLSPEDVDALHKGYGWGLAKPAELNGYPGPAHVLELAGKLALTTAQKDKIGAIYNDMKQQAQEVGKRYVASERRVDALFKEKTVTAAALQAALRDTESLRRQLREIHLKAHLTTTPLLSEHQRHLYNRLRGYAGHRPHSHSGHAN